MCYSSPMAKKKSYYTKEQRKNFSENLIGLMEEKGIHKDVDLAKGIKKEGEKEEALAVSIGRWRKGEHMPDLHNLISLAQFFHVTLDHLIKLKGVDTILSHPDCLIYKDHQYAGEIQKTVEVLESNTEEKHAEALLSNINSFHASVLKSMKQAEQDRIMDIVLKRLDKLEGEKGGHRENKRPFGSQEKDAEHGMEQNQEDNHPGKTEKKKPDNL